MAVTVNITSAETPVTVDITPPAAAPVTVEINTVETPVSVWVNTSAPAIVVDVTPPPATPVQVDFSEARDAYQLAVLEGFVGTRPEWLASLQGEDGKGVEIVVVANLAAYLALSPAEQMSGKWFVVPKTP
ncbi:MAG: hypothetical protein Q8Q59_06290 [Luteolibacter sp.]|jgi:hypothetical protein|nr:hypothetical protein [Luteolibacter sp.]